MGRHLSDMSIEETLMRSTKSSGGLARGAMRNDDSLKVWLHTATHKAVISEEMAKVYQKITKKRDVDSMFSHSNTSPTAMARDQAIVANLVEFFKDTGVFDRNREPEKLVSLGSGIIDTDGKCNPEKARDQGEEIHKQLDGKPYTTPVSRKLMITNFAAETPVVRVGEKRLDCDIYKLFTRLLLIGGRECGVKECLQYELTQHPLSLYKPDGGVRKKDKSELGRYFRDMMEEVTDSPPCDIVVIDGGWLLFQVGSNFP